MLLAEAQHRRQHRLTAPSTGHICNKGRTSRSCSTEQAAREGEEGGEPGEDVSC